MGKPARPYSAARPGIAQRDAEIVRRYQGGEDFASIATSLDLSREHVRQIVMSSGTRMPREYKCAVKECSTSPRAPKRYCYAHQRRLELYGDPLGSKSLRREQHGTAACYRQGGCRCDLCREAAAARHREYEHRVHPEMRRYTTRGQP